MITGVQTIEVITNGVVITVVQTIEVVITGVLITEVVITGV